MENQKIANLSVFESLQNVANAKMGGVGLGAFNDRERVENGSGGIEHLKRKQDAVSKKAFEMKEGSAERAEKQLQSVDLVARISERGNEGEKRKKAMQDETLARIKGGDATTEDCFTFRPPLWYSRK